MFEVQLGASLLIQFKTRQGRTVRVLADGGQGPPIANIHSKLIDAMQEFDAGQRRIDLLVGTHYDADHLDGLIPIINDTSIAITEAWLPPIANDVDLYPSAESLGDHHLLPNQLYSSDGYRILLPYLNFKLKLCRNLRMPNVKESAIPHGGRDLTSADLEKPELVRKWFEDYRDEARRELQGHTETEPFSHANDADFDPPAILDLIKYVEPFIWTPYRWRELSEIELDSADFAQLLQRLRPNSVAQRNLATIRKSAARDAINVISLNAVTDALCSREIPIECRTIADGSPRRFVWRDGSGRFEGSPYQLDGGPTLTVLGPSEGLVKKHWHRLPIGVYVGIALFSISDIKSITPSNQLSYVMRFSANKQAILVSGDAGFVDAKPKGRRPYYRAILRELSRLHVVQVAHHAGDNAHFYRVLQAAKYPLAKSKSFLLVSHATHDRYRPSRQFREFTEDVRRDPEVVSVLFTTQPLDEKIRSFASLIYRNVGPTGDRGDVRLEYGRRGWVVTRHAIVVGPPPTTDLRRAAILRACKKISNH
jgi:hypothetical protein